jgi:quercetin dioxygenase-like cupin family protein
MDVLVDFDKLPWESPRPGMRSKAFVQGSRRLRLLEFAGGYEEPEWCTREHAFHVLDGGFSLLLRDDRVHLEAGDTGFLPAGDEHAHKAVLGADEHVLLLLFEVL